MTTVVSAIIATFVTFPLLPWLLVCFVLLRWQPKQKAIRNASDWTLPFSCWLLFLSAMSFGQDMGLGSRSFLLPF